MSWYKTGTVAINNASTTVTGAGTAWVDNVDVGEGIRLPDGRTYEITGVVSNTSLTIGEPYLGTNTSGQPYAIQPFRGRTAALTARASELLDSFQVVRDGIGAGLFPDGSATEPAFRFVADQDTGIARSANNSLGIVGGGTLLGVFNTNGLGLGTTTPAVKLDVAAPPSSGQVVEVARWSNNGTGPGTRARLTFYAANTLYGSITGGFGSASPEMVYDVGTGGFHAWSIGGSVRASLLPNGNFGIGTTTPSHRLSLPESGLVEANLGGVHIGRNGTNIEGGLGALALVATGTGSLIFSTGASGEQRMLITAGGNVGIRTTSPQAPLHVNGSVEVARLSTTAARGTGSIFQSFFDASGRKGYIGYGASDDSFFVSNDVNAPILFATNNAVRLAITNSATTPGIDSAHNLGAASVRWSTVFAVTGTISTSDEREKTWRGALTPDELRAAKRIIAELGIYQWNDAIAEKGAGNARLHFGVRAQQAFDIMEDEGLDWTRYAWCCHDEWDEQTEPVMEEVTVTKTRPRANASINMETGEPIHEDDLEEYEVTEMHPTGETRVTLEAGDRYGVRTDQLALWLIAAQADIQADLETRLAVLQTRLAALEAA